MSEMEYNKGRAIPVTWNMVKSEFPDADINDLPYDTDGKFEIINGQPYLIEMENHGINYVPEVINFDVYDSGIICFETYHYNSGAYYTEIIERELIEFKKEKESLKHGI